MVLDDWKALLSQYYVVYDISHATGMSDMQTMFLTLRLRKLSNGQTLTASVPLSAANDLKAGVMTASHVQTLMSLQTTMPQLRSAITSLQTLIGQHDQSAFHHPIGRLCRNRHQPGQRTQQQNKPRRHQARRAHR